MQTVPLAASTGADGVIPISGAKASPWHVQPGLSVAREVVRAPTELADHDPFERDLGVIAGKSLELKLTGEHR